MKRTLAIFLVVFYGLLSVGIHVHLHYCCGDLTGIHFNSDHRGCCETQDTEGCSVEKSCCVTEQIDFTIENEHFSSAFNWVSHAIESSPIHIPATLPLEEKNDVFTSFETGVVHRRLFLEHSSLLLYA